MGGFFVYAFPRHGARCIRGRCPGRGRQRPGSLLRFEVLAVQDVDQRLEH